MTQPGETLATHPNGHRLTVYQQDGQNYAALYCHGSLLREHTDGSWYTLTFDGHRGPPLPAGTITELAALAPTNGDSPPLLPDQAGILDHRPAQPAAETGIFVDWAAFWAAEPDEQRWLYEPILAKNRGHAIFAAHKIGKSLILLYISLQLATSPEPVAVIYLDYEMTRDDLEDRLTDMGITNETDLERLRYALLPALPPLDTAAGADCLLEIVDEERARRPDFHQVVIVDTTARAVSGEENSADTIRAFYRNTGSALKRRGITWARLDHAGKDPDKGQRGSSAKGDDVDIIWRINQVDGGLRFTREAARVSFVPETIDLARTDEPLRFTPSPKLWDEKVKPVAELLDRFGAPTDITVNAARQLLKEHGEGARNNVLNDAVRYRKLGPNLKLLCYPVMPGNAGNGGPAGG